MKIDLDQIRLILGLVAQSEVTELTIESGDEKITVRKAGSYSPEIEFSPQAARPVAVAPVAPAAAPAPKPEVKASENGHDEVSAANGLIPISSPMVGTFYRSPSPAAAAFVDVGDRIKPGQTVCIIEAMKLMNDMPSEIAGKIVKVCVENGTTVEYGQALFMVDPRG